MTRGRADEVVELAVTRRGTGARVVLVHGFTQTGACWGPVADDLAADNELLLVDAPGHGGSSALRPSFTEGAALMGSAGGAATYVGYSMGGRYLLALAIARPDLVERLVLIGASPGLSSAEERAARRASDEALADHLCAIGLPAFLDEWLALPLFAGLTEEMQFRTERLANDPEGLASSLRLAGTGAQDPLWERLPTLEMPVLLVTGALDAKFTAIAEQMNAAIGANATHVTIEGAGHTAHLENPEAFLATLRAWLLATDAR
jgi:2-succinyl-6-hydroxy-2,4-cyclohexadiene-1-carboxylate synthase